MKRPSLFVPVFWSYPLLECKACINRHACIFRILCQVTGKAAGFPDITKTVIVTGTQGEGRYVKSYTASQTYIPTIEVVRLQIGSALDVSIAVDIFYIGRNQVAQIRTGMDAEISCNVDYSQDGQFHIPEVETIFSVALYKITIGVFCPFDTIQQLRLDGEPGGNGKFGIDSRIEADFHVLFGYIVRIKARKGYRTLDPKFRSQLITACDSLLLLGLCVEGSYC